MDARRSIGIDIGGTKIAAALVTIDGGVSHLTKVDTPVVEGPASIVKAVINQIKTLHIQAASQQLSIIGVGIGSAGQIDVETGTVVYAVETMPGWTGTALGAAVKTATGLPVIVENDVNAMALGELHFGAGRGYASTLYAAVGTGIGGALILNGQLWRGVNWSAGELGHVLVDYRSDRVCNCGATGHLEACAAGPAIARAYYQRKGLPETGDLHPVVKAAESGDRLAQEAIAEGARIMGEAMAGLAAVFNPEALILGGGVALLGDIWWSPFEAAVRANPMPAAQKIALKRAELGNQAALIGAARLAWERLHT
jgi:glucokinase